MSNPTVAVSDTFNVLAHVYACHLAYEAREYVAVFGFMMVVIAAAVGVVRFGFNDNLALLNENLADVAAFVGLPLVGLCFAVRVPQFAAAAAFVLFNTHNLLAFSLLLFVIETVANSSRFEVKNLLRTVVNVVFFILPTGARAWIAQDLLCALSISLFVLAGLVIAPNNHKSFLGVRCINWFHYCLGLSAVGIASSLH